MSKIRLFVCSWHGYRCDPEDKDHWILEEKQILTAKALYAKRKKKPMPERPYHWGNQSIVEILERQEYTGCTINFKTYSKSYKLKKRIPNNPEDMFYLPDTQEAIVSQAQFDRVQELRKNKRRPAKAERQGFFSGLLFCADCGGKLFHPSSLIAAYITLIIIHFSILIFLSIHSFSIQYCKITMFINYFLTKFYFIIRKTSCSCF